MLWHLGADRAEARRVLERIAGRLRGEEPFRLVAQVECEPVAGCWGWTRVPRWTAEVEQEAPGRALLKLGFADGGGTGEQRRSLRVLARDGGVWSDAGAGWAGLVASGAEYVAGLPRLYSAFEGASGLRVDRKGQAPGVVRVTGQLGHRFAETRTALGRVGEGWEDGISVREGRFAVYEGADSAEITLQFRVEGDPSDDRAGARPRVELETVTVRADRFGDASLQVPEAPGPVEVGGGGGGSLLGAVHYCLFRVVPEASVAAVAAADAEAAAELADPAVPDITVVVAERVGFAGEAAGAEVDVDGAAVPEGPELDAGY